MVLCSINLTGVRVALVAAMADGLLRMLRERECGDETCRNTTKRRKMAAQLPPERSVRVSDAPDETPRRFSPDGKTLFCFGSAMRDFCAYEFAMQGAGADPGDEKDAFRKRFRLKYRCRVTSSRLETLCADFCLMLHGGKHVLLATSSPNARRGDVRGRSRLVVVDAQDGTLRSQVVLPGAVVELPFHAGVSLAPQKDTIAVLVLNQQQILFYAVHADGTLHYRGEIGETCDLQWKAGRGAVDSSTEQENGSEARTDATTTAATTTSRTEGDQSQAGEGEEVGQGRGGRSNQPGTSNSYGNRPLITGIKQRLLVYLYGMAARHVNKDERVRAIRWFYAHFEQVADLAMHRMQYLDEDHILIRFAPPGPLMVRYGHPPQGNALFVVYNMKLSHVLHVSQNTSKEFLHIYAMYSEYFRHVDTEDDWQRYRSTYSNCMQMQEELLQSKAGGNTDSMRGTLHAAKRALAVLPHPPQTINPTPYLDPSLFEYDEKMIAPFDRPRPCPEYPIKFMHRSNDSMLAFKIDATCPASRADPRVKWLSSYVFHPIYPFAISALQSFMQSTVIKFHMRS